MASFRLDKFLAEEDFFEEDMTEYEGVNFATAFKQQQLLSEINVTMAKILTVLEGMAAFEKRWFHTASMMGEESLGGGGSSSGRDRRGLVPDDRPSLSDNEDAEAKDDGHSVSDSESVSSASDSSDSDSSESGSGSNSDSSDSDSFESGSGSESSDEEDSDEEDKASADTKRRSQDKDKYREVEVI